MLKPQLSKLLTFESDTLLNFPKLKQAEE